MNITFISTCYVIEIEIEKNISKTRICRHNYSNEDFLF